MRLVRDAHPALAAAVLVVVLALGACSEPEPTSYPLTISMLADGEVCAVGDATKELCFAPDLMVDVPDDGAHLGDCLTVEVTEPGGSEVTRAAWRGRCTSVGVGLGVTMVDGSPVILIPECLGSLTSLRIDDGVEEGADPLYSVAREGSAQHPLIRQVDVAEVPPGFVEHDAWTAPAEDVELTASANQQFDLPAGTVTFTLGELDDSVVTTKDRYPTRDEFESATGCRATG